jgi:hypothetical protein
MSSLAWRFGCRRGVIYEYGVGGLMKLAGPVDPSTVEGMLSGAFKRAGVTATAGATSELSRILIDTAAMGNSSEFDLDMKRLRSEGMSAEEAWRQTFTDYVERVVDTGVRSGRYGLIAGLSEYGGEYFRQHPEAFNALVNGKTGWSGGMRGLPPGGEGGLLGLSSTYPIPGGGAGTQRMPIPQGPAVKDDWETAIEEAVAKRKGSGTGRPEEPENIDISGKYDIIGTGTRGQEILWEKDLRGDSDNVPDYKGINIHGVLNSELDEVDLMGHVIYEDKNANKLYMEKPDRPQTEQQWADKQIYLKKNRIFALRQEIFRMSSEKSVTMPPMDDLKAVRTFLFRIDADTPGLRKAVQAAMERLSKTFPEYEFYAVFGGK